MPRLVSGAIAGLIATAPMSAVIGLGRAARLLWTPPPEQITSSAAESIGVNPNEASDEFKATWLTAHFAYGAVGGAIYSLARPVIPGSLISKGLLFGGAVWGVSYLGFVPAIGLYPWPKDDSRTRMAVMIAAHAVYGIGTAVVEKSIAKIEQPPEYYIELKPLHHQTIRRM